jgi:hypothetical protein
MACPATPAMPIAELASAGNTLSIRSSAMA